MGQAPKKGRRTARKGRREKSAARRQASGKLRHRQTSPMADPDKGERQKKEAACLALAVQK